MISPHEPQFLEPLGLRAYLNLPSELLAACCTGPEFVRIEAVGPLSYVLAGLADMEVDDGVATSYAGQCS